MSGNPFLDHALAAAAKGIPVFRCKAGSKEPAFKGWQKEATTDPEQIKALWGEDRYNIGLAMGNGLVGLDIDMKKGKDGMASFRALGLTADTLIHKTASGGYHVIWKTELAFNNSASRIGDGLDLRASGGYLVGPGSVLSNGSGKGSYSVHREHDIGDAPSNLLHSHGRQQPENLYIDLDDAGAVTHARDWLLGAQPAVEGKGGDDLTYRTAAHVKDLGVSEVVCLQLMAENWNERCSPPWQTDDLAKKVADAYLYGQNEPGSQSVQAMFSGVNIEPPEPPKVEAFPVFRHEDAEAYDVTNLMWLFDSTIPAAGTTVLVGPSQSGKTFIASEMARCLATGKPFFGKRPDELGGTVIVFTGTEGSGFPLRIKALEEKKPLPITAITAGSLAARGALDRLVAFLKEEDKRMREVFGIPLRLVVLETLSASGLLPIENDNSQAAMAMTNMAAVARAVNVQLIVSHHPAKTGEGARGAGAIYDNTDTVLEIFRQGKDPYRRIEVTKGRNTEQRAIGSFTLLKVELGKDTKGRPVTSMVVSMGEAIADLRHSAPNHVERFNQAVDFTDAVEIEEQFMIPEHKVREQFEDLLEGTAHRTSIYRAYKKCLEYAVNLGVMEKKAVDGVVYLIVKDFDND